MKLDSPIIMLVSPPVFCPLSHPIDILGTGTLKTSHRLTSAWLMF
jgi:hypothetical protein